MDLQEIKALYPRRKCVSCGTVTEAHTWPVNFIFQTCPQCKTRFQYYCPKQNRYIAATTVNNRANKKPRKHNVTTITADPLKMPIIRPPNQDRFQCIRCGTKVKNHVLLHLRMDRLERVKKPSPQTHHLGHEIWCSSCIEAADHSVEFFSIPLSITGDYSSMSLGRRSTKVPSSIVVTKQMALKLNTPDAWQVCTVLSHNHLYKPLSQRRTMNPVFKVVKFSTRLPLNIESTGDDDEPSFFNQKGFLSVKLNTLDNKHIGLCEATQLLCPYTSLYTGSNLTEYYKNVVKMTWNVMLGHSTEDTQFFTKQSNQEEEESTDLLTLSNNSDEKYDTLSPPLVKNTHKRIYANDPEWIRISTTQKVLKAFLQFDQKWPNGVSPHTPLSYAFWNRQRNDLYCVRSKHAVPDLFLTFTTPRGTGDTSQVENPIIALSWFQKFTQLVRECLDLKSNCFNQELSTVVTRTEATKDGLIHFHCTISFKNSALFKPHEHIQNTPYGCGQEHIPLVSRLQQENAESNGSLGGTHSHRVRPYIPSLLLKWRCRMDVVVVSRSHGGTLKGDLVEDYISKEIPSCTISNSSESHLPSQDLLKTFHVKDGNIVLKDTVLSSSKEYRISSTRNAPSIETASILYHMNIPPTLGVLYLYKAPFLQIKGVCVRKLPYLYGGYNGSETPIVIRNYMDRPSDLEKYSLSLYVELFDHVRTEEKKPQYAKTVHSSSTTGVVYRLKKKCVTRGVPLSVIQSESVRYKQIMMLSFPLRALPSNEESWQEIVLRKCDAERHYTLQDAVTRIQERDGHHIEWTDDLPSSFDYEHGLKKLRDTMSPVEVHSHLPNTIHIPDNVPVHSSKMSNDSSRKPSSPSLDNTHDLSDSSDIFTTQPPVQTTILGTKADAIYKAVMDEISNSSSSKHPRTWIVHGPAGCGKSTLICKVREACVEKSIPLTINCLTGTACNNLNLKFREHSDHLSPTASTLHHFLGLRRRKFTHRDHVLNKDSELKVVIVDEVSMVSRTLLDTLIDTILKHNNQFGKHQPVLFLLLGDLFQLHPPVGESCFNSTHFSNGENIRFFSMDDQKNLRATSSQYETFLRRVRFGIDFSNQEDRDYIKSRQINPHSLYEFLSNISRDDVEHVSVLTDTNRQKQRINNLFKKRAIKSGEETFVLDSIVCTREGIILHPPVQAVHDVACFELNGWSDDSISTDTSTIDHFILKRETKAPTEIWKEKHLNDDSISIPRASYARLVRQFYEGISYKAIGTRSDESKFPHAKSVSLALNESSTFISPLTLTVWRGARVMLLKNLKVEQGLVNGAMGIVHGFKHTKDGIVSKICVKFDNINDIITIDRIQEEHVTTEGRIYVQVQFPLTISHATSIHRAQGHTIQKKTCIVAFDDRSGPGCANPALFYVALSRFKVANAKYGPLLVNFSQERHFLRRGDAFEMLRPFVTHDSCLQDAYRRYFATTKKIDHQNQSSLKTSPLNAYATRMTLKQANNSPHTVLRDTGGKSPVIRQSMRHNNANSESVYTLQHTTTVNTEANCTLQTPSKTPRITFPSTSFPGRRSQITPQRISHSPLLLQNGAPRYISHNLPSPQPQRVMYPILSIPRETKHTLTHNHSLHTYSSTSPQFTDVNSHISNPLRPSPLSHQLKHEDPLHGVVLFPVSSMQNHATMNRLSPKQRHITNGMMAGEEQCIIDSTSSNIPRHVPQTVSVVRHTSAMFQKCSYETEVSPLRSRSNSVIRSSHRKRKRGNDASHFSVKSPRFK